MIFPFQFTAHGNQSGLFPAAMQYASTKRTKEPSRVYHLLYLLKPTIVMFYKVAHLSQQVSLALQLIN